MRVATSEIGFVTAMRAMCRGRGLAVGPASSRGPIRGTAKVAVAFGQGPTAGCQVVPDGGGSLSAGAEAGLSAEGAAFICASRICRAVIADGGPSSPTFIGPTV